MGESNLAPQKQPFLYLTASFLSGIVTDRWSALSATPVFWLLALLWLLTILFVVICLRRRQTRRATLALLLAVSLGGWLLSQAERAGIEPHRLQKLFDARVITDADPVELTGVLRLPPEPAPDGFFLDVEAEMLSHVGAPDEAAGKESADKPTRATQVVTGRARLFLSPADEQSAAVFRQLELDSGSRLRVLVRLERARAYRNPGAPDFNDFLERQGYDLKGTIKSPLLMERLGDAPTNGLLARLYRFRLRLLAALDAQFRPPVAGTLKAMLLGNKYFLDPQVSERLREGATFHTLVISGFHISVLAWVVLTVRLRFWRRRRGGGRASLFRVCAALLVLWAYTMMVGLSPPVTRATVMVTIGLFAPLLFRHAASINTVSLAAFLMLVWQPSLVADAGFQLSFLAVVAIVALALPLLEKLKSVGAWRPTAPTPQPPRCGKLFCAFAETLYWDEREFRREMQSAPITYRLEKSAVALRINRWRLQPLWRAVVVLLITSTAIQLTTLPLMIAYFNRVAPVGVLLNVTAGLLTSAMMALSIAALAAGAVAAELATPLVWLVNLAHALLVDSIKPFAPLPLMSFRVPHYEGWQAIVYAAYFLPLGVLVALLDNWQPVLRFPFSVFRPAAEAARMSQSDADQPRQLKTENRRLTTVLATAALLLVLLAFFLPPSRLPHGKLTLYFLDVGQGDAALIVFPQGTTMLVDGGGEPAIENRADETADPAFKDSSFSIGEAVVSRFLWSQGVSRLDYLLATHADADHIGGLADVAKNFSIGEALIGRFENPTREATAEKPPRREFRRFAQRLADRRIPLAQLARGERFTIDGVLVEILHPPPTARQLTASASSLPAAASANNDSVVLRLSYGATAMLLTGDIEREAEDLLSQAGVRLRATLLKVPHHGSKTSSTARFLDLVEPQQAVISVGERSRFRHPHTEVVARYGERGIALWQTGRDGCVTVQSDGVTVTARGYRE